VDEILKYRRIGRSYGWIANKLGIPKATVAYHCSEKTRILSANRRRKRRIEIKQRAVQYKGGKCCICGYSRCLAALEFHHPDPTSKEIGVNNALGSGGASFEAIKCELDKCHLVCSNCHREVHAGLAVIPG
jgi:hypothetical protein